MTGEEVLARHVDLRDEDVVAQVLSGETAMFEVLMRRYNQRLFRVARGVLGDDADAEEVVQEAHVRAYTQLSQVRNHGAFGAWISRTALRIALDRWRSRRRSPVIDQPQPPTDLSAGDADPEEQTARGELRRLIDQAVDNLSDGNRLAFILRDVEGLSTADAADLLQCTEEAVKVRLHRARAALRTELDRQLGPTVREAFSFAGARCDRMVRLVFGRLQVSDRLE